MWTTFISQIDTLLTQLTGSGKPLQVVYNYPETEISGYPAAIFFPSNFTNEYDSVTENSKNYQFSIFLLVETTVLGLETAYTSAMPGLVDAVVAKFDDEWDAGQTIVGNHRIWWTISNGAWGLVTAEKQTYLQAELTLTIQFNTNV